MMPGVRADLDKEKGVEIPCFYILDWSSLESRSRICSDLPSRAVLGSKVWTLDYCHPGCGDPKLHPVGRAYRGGRQIAVHGRLELVHSSVIQDLVWVVDFGVRATKMVWREACSCRASICWT